MKTAWCLLVAALATPALAQDFQNFKPAPGTRNYFTIDRAEPTPEWDFVPSMYFNYAKNPLVRRDEDTGEITEEIVADLLSFNAMGAFGFAYDLELGVDVPLGHASGTDIATLGDGGFALGDVRLIPKWRLSPADEAGGVALVVPLILPTATGGDGQGTSSIVVEPKLVAGVTFPFFSLAANVGFRYRPDAEGVEDLSFGSEVTYGGGVGVPLGTPRWLAMGEVFGSVPVLAAEGASEPLEGHLGLRWFAPLGPVFSVGGGRGFVAGRGSPDYRVSFGIAWDPRIFDEPVEAPPPPPPPPPPMDSDGDGLLDPVDKCPQEPEDKDDFQDEDGCPDPDNDEDGIVDAQDKCPLEAEDKDTWLDDDGCPDPDNDNDKILDAVDKCPLKAEDVDGFKDDDGCPDPDNDQDGIADARDKCPNEPEVYNEFEDDDGCPDKGQSAKIVVTRQKVEILEKVYFDFNKATIKRKSYPLLDQVAAVLKANPDIKVMRVEGHTDRHGNAKHNKWLSTWRAKAVMRYLTVRGVAAERLVSEGYGFSRPLEATETEEADAVNRRVEFVIVDRADEDAPP